VVEVPLHRDVLHSVNEVMNADFLSSSFTSEGEDSDGTDVPRPNCDSELDAQFLVIRILKAVIAGLKLKSVIGVFQN
jgi:hypothetical protein